MIGSLTSTHRTQATSDAVAILRTVAIASLFGAQAIHVRAMIDHARVWPAAAVFFFAIAVMEGSTAAWLLLSPSRRVARFAVMLSFATIAVWVVSRAGGLPIGPHPWIGEPSAAPDAIATGLEMVTAASLVAWLRRSDGGEPMSAAGLALAGAVVGIVITLTWIGITTPGHLTAVGS